MSKYQHITEIQENSDLVTCAHALEHIPDPIRFLRETTHSAHVPVGSLVYPEAPLERYALAGLLQSQSYGQYLSIVQKSRLLTIAIDFFSVLSRARFQKVFPPLLLKLHEHLNFYASASLSKVAASAGLDALAVSEEQGAIVSTHTGVIRLLSRKR